MLYVFGMVLIARLELVIMHHKQLILIQIPSVNHFYQHAQLLELEVVKLNYLFVQIIFNNHNVFKVSVV